MAHKVFNLGLGTQQVIVRGVCVCVCVSILKAILLCNICYLPELLHSFKWSIWAQGGNRVCTPYFGEQNVAVRALFSSSMCLKARAGDQMWQGDMSTEFEFIYQLYNPGKIPWTLYDPQSPPL